MQCQGWAMQNQNYSTCIFRPATLIILTSHALATCCIEIHCCRNPQGLSFK
ncbi:hypothetical protein BDA96_03G092000 [Sorghum bicolor]|uniref:Uncharacterized protein n=2 Tax=Sorghum bicolor TaxID=4558 RepID=A0A921UMR1_SORBI|nr:hypothetical protein BDA96_03G092000 [Sorghum bicolor]KXG31988.1 hypothetical protein SORBI_3003G087800 [Sorghum bicolor]